MREKYKTLFICLFCFALASCGAKQHIISLQVVPKIAGKAIDCLNLQSGQKQWQIQQLAFFMSNIQHQVSADNKTINSDSPVSLVRIDSQTCSGKLHLVSDKPLMPGDTLRFDLGVPFELNHLNPVTQPAPLNEPDMFWTWRNGYKFLRIDMQQKDMQQDDTQQKDIQQINSGRDTWAYHLGSVGCVSASAVRSPTAACAKPNLSHHKMTVPVGEGLELVLHLDRLMKDIVPGKANRCVMHGDTEPACESLYANITEPSAPLFSLEAR